MRHRFSLLVLGWTSERQSFSTKRGDRFPKCRALPQFCKLAQRFFEALQSNLADVPRNLKMAPRSPSKQGENLKTSWRQEEAFREAPHSRLASTHRSQHATWPARPQGRRVPAVRVAQ